MELFEAILTRRSIRSFLDKPVAESDIDQLLRAAMAAPSAGNQQSWSFIVIRDKKKLAAIPAIHPYAKMLTQAPVAILVCGRIDGKWPTFWSQDCSAATQNILLAARDLGLATVWAGIYPEKERMEGMRKLFSIPGNVHPFAIVPIGYSETEFKEVDRFNPEHISYDTWGNIQR